MRLKRVTVDDGTIVISLNRKEEPMQRLIGFLALVVLLTGFSGCSYLFYPHAKEFSAKAKGETALDTLINLTAMMEASAKTAKGGNGYDQPLNDLHNQFHALHDSFCDVTEAQAKKPEYALAHTHEKELWAIFKRLWKYKDDQPQRDQHLDLFVSEVKELRETLQTLK
jgi:hypothetical protein